MERRASRLLAAAPLPRMTTSISLLSMVTVVAVEPVSSDRTAAPTPAAVRPYWAAASRRMVTVTWGTCRARELVTSTASGSWPICWARSSAMRARVLLSVPVMSTLMSAPVLIRAVMSEEVMVISHPVMSCSRGRRSLATSSTPRSRLLLSTSTRFTELLSPWAV